jgi:GAF domain-containing protein
MTKAGICQRQMPTPAPRLDSTDTIVDMGTPDSEIYKALFDLSQSIAGHADLETLCNSLAGSLRRVISFDFLGLVLHDPVDDQLRVHAVSASRPYKEKEIVVPTDSEHIGARVWREQKPPVLSRVEIEARQSDDALHEALEEGVQALTLVPLSNGDHRLGILGFGFSTPFRPDGEALGFLHRVASEVAVSIDGYLTRQALFHAEECKADEPSHRVDSFRCHRSPYRLRMAGQYPGVAERD